jgi:hypothetical protein
MKSIPREWYFCNSKVVNEIKRNKNEMEMLNPKPIKDITLYTGLKLLS